MGAVRGETHPDSVHPRNHSSARDEIQRNARHPRAKGPGGFRRRTILAWARATRGPYRTQTPAEASETLLEGGLSRDHHPLAPPNPPKDLPPNPSERLELELAFLTETAHRLARPQDGAVELSFLLERLRDVLGCAAVALLEVWPEAIVLRSDRSETRDDEGSALPIHLGAIIVDRLVGPEPVVTIGPTEEPDLQPLTARLLGAGRLENGVAVPLGVRNPRPRGILVALNRSPGFSPGDSRLLLAAADQISVALERERIDREQRLDRARAEILSASLRLARPKNEHALLLNAMRTLATALGAGKVEFAVPDGEEVRVRLAVPETHQPGEDAQTWVLHRQAAETGRVVVCSAEAVDEGKRSHACAPLRASRGVVATVLVTRDGRAFDDAERALIATAADDLARALETTRAFERTTNELDRVRRELDEREAALKEAHEQLGRQSWLASLGELAAGVAHDLNNALNPIVAFAELIKEHGDHPDRVRMYADRILMAAQGGAETVRRIQRFTRHRGGPLPVEAIPLAALVEEAIELTRPTWSKRNRDAIVHVEQDVDPGILIQGNAAEIRQALINLITNALDAMEGKGTVRFVGRRDGEQALLAVQDTGHGMPADVVERALEPFFTTKGARGTGLGLPEVYGIARRHGGNLEIETWPGVGTTVLLRLPRAHAVLPSEPKHKPATRVAEGTSYRILLVDDNALNLEATAASLRAAGHQVTTATDARSALDLFSPGIFDIVLSDLGLPDLSGWELVDRLRSQDPAIRIGVITGWNLPEADEELTRRGIRLVFCKPVDPDELIAAL